ncbi:MAG: hypothetical protein ABGX31_02930 [bacterium]
MNLYLDWREQGETTALLPSFGYYGSVPTATAQDQVLWNNDGHTISLRLNKAELEIVAIVCPFPEGDEEAPCRSKTGCVVKHFVNLYGMECNIGVCPPEPTMEISWCLQGDFSDIDTSQLWFVPTEDEVFYAWMSQKEV